MTKYNKNIAFTKIPDNYINELLNSGDTIKAMVFMLDIMTQKLRGKKFATRTIEKEIKEASISRATISRYRKEFAQFLTIFDAAQDSPVKKTMRQKRDTSETKARQKQTLTKPINKADTETSKSLDIPEMRQGCANSETIIKIKIKIKILKEEEEEIYQHLHDIYFDEIAFEVFALDFYDYIYPSNEKPNQQKIWFGNRVRNEILELDSRTIQNVRGYVEFKEQQAFR